MEGDKKPSLRMERQDHLWMGDRTRHTPELDFEAMLKQYGDSKMSTRVPLDVLLNYSSINDIVEEPENTENDADYEVTKLKKENEYLLYANSVLEKELQTKKEEVNDKESKCTKLEAELSRTLKVMELFTKAATGMADRGQLNHGEKEAGEAATWMASQGQLQPGGQGSGGTSTRMAGQRQLHGGGQGAGGAATGMAGQGQLQCGGQGAGGAATGMAGQWQQQRGGQGAGGAATVIAGQGQLQSGGQGARGAATWVASQGQLQDFGRPPTTTPPTVVTLGETRITSQEGMLRNIQQLLQNGMAALLI